MAADADIVGAQVLRSARELFVKPLFRQADTDYGGSVRIELGGTVRSAGLFYVIVNANISRRVLIRTGRKMKVWVGGGRRTGCRATGVGQREAGIQFRFLQC
jgi:hypothetical protein